MKTKKQISLIIIDDDFTSRNTIKNYLGTSNSYYIAHDFSNANDALGWLKDHEADIAICDMKMPNIDGIEFISQALKFQPNLHFLAISAYSDFHYLRDCIINSVEDYILKHDLAADLLVNTLDKIKRKYNIKQGQVFPTNNYHIIDGDRFKYDVIIDLIRNGLIHFIPDLVLPVIISPDYNYELFPEYTIFSNNTIPAIQDIICNILDNRYSYILHMSSSFQFALLFSFDTNENCSIIQGKRQSFFQLLKDKVQRLINVSLTIAYPSTTMKLEQAMQFFDLTTSLREEKLYLKPGSIFIPEINDKRFSDKYTLPAYINEQIRTLSELKDFHGLEEIIHFIFLDLSNKKIDHKTVTETCIQLCAIICSVLIEKKSDDYLNQINFTNLEYIQQFEKIILNIIDCVIQTMPNTNKQIYSIAVARAISFIEENYKDSISLEKCAEYVDISYTHLSRIFKKETAFPFSEYLNRFRISKAKMLLAENKMAVKRIVSEAGFTNYNYFFRVFKEVEGVTPVEYAVSANNYSK